MSVCCNHRDLEKYFSPAHTPLHIQVHAPSSTEINASLFFASGRASVKTGLVSESYFTDVTFDPCQATMCLGHVLGQARWYPSASRPQVRRVHERGVGGALVNTQLQTLQLAEQERGRTAANKFQGRQDPIMSCFHDMHSSEGPCRKWERTSVCSRGNISTDK